VTKIIAIAAALALSTGIALADTNANAPLAPSAVLGATSTYDHQSVTVSGTVKNVTTRQTQRGTMAQYQLCDSQCVNVISPGSTPPTEGSTQTVTGMFHTNLSHGKFQATNVITVMPPGGWNHPH
jgi:cytochrome c-type biogenesis protein CcmE